jgi:hypothetical protein
MQKGNAGYALVKFAVLPGRIEAVSNVHKPKAIRHISMQMKITDHAIKDITLNDFVPQLPPPTESIAQGEARMRSMLPLE